MTDEEMRAKVQAEAERTFNSFILLSKRGSYVIIAIILLAAMFNFGVDESKYPGYNGEQYNPSGLSNETK